MAGLDVVTNYIISKDGTNPSSIPKRYCKVEVRDAQNNIKTFLNQNSIGARIDFDVTRKTQTFENGFSIAEIKLFNLSDDTFKFLRDSGREISLTAGHQNVQNAVIGQLFDGFIYSVMRTKVDTDVITILYCSTLDPKNSRLNLVFSKSYQNISLVSLIQNMATEMGLTLAMDTGDFTGITITNKSFFKDCKLVLDHLARLYAFTWEIRGTKLVILKIGSDKVRLFEFSRASGLLRPPVVTEKGVDIEIFLEPNINPSDKFLLNAQYASFNLGALEFQDRLSSKINIGTIRVTKDSRYVGKYTTLFLVHNGSTHTNQWSTKIDGWMDGVN
jgi:hypothetical protein